MDNSKTKKEGTEEIDKIIANITLNVFNVGTKQTNFYILKSLPSDVGHIMKETGLTKVPVNNRINELEKYGLLIREKGTGKVYPTELTKQFMLLIAKIETYVKNNVSNMLPILIK